MFHERTLANGKTKSSEAAGPDQGQSPGLAIPSLSAAGLSVSSRDLYCPGNLKIYSEMITQSLPMINLSLAVSVARAAQHTATLDVFQIPLAHFAAC